MEDIILFILQCIWEVLLQALWELVFELICRGIAGVYKSAPAYYLAAGGCAAMGAIAGALSLWLMPHALIHRESFRILNVIIAPVLVAALMSVIGRLRAGKGQQTVRLDTFQFAYWFALAMALVRFRWAI